MCRAKRAGQRKGRPSRLGCRKPRWWWRCGKPLRRLGPRTDCNLARLGRRQASELQQPVSLPCTKKSTVLIHPRPQGLLRGGQGRGGRPTVLRHGGRKLPESLSCVPASHRSKHRCTTISQHNGQAPVQRWYQAYHLVSSCLRRRLHPGLLISPILKGAQHGCLAQWHLYGWFQGGRLDLLRGRERRVYVHWHRTSPCGIARTGPRRHGSSCHFRCRRLQQRHGPLGCQEGVLRTCCCHCRRTARPRRTRHRAGDA